MVTEVPLLAFSWEKLVVPDCLTVPQTWLGLRLVLFPGLSGSGDQVFGKRSFCDLWLPTSLPLSFLGIQPAHLLRWMLTVQNPKKSWLATKPAYSLVDDASLGHD